MSTNKVGQPSTAAIEAQKQAQNQKPVGKGQVDVSGLMMMNELATGALMAGQKSINAGATMSALANAGIGGENAGTNVASMVANTFSLLGLGIKDVPTASENGMVGAFADFPLMNKKENRALQTEAGESFARLLDKKQETQIETTTKNLAALQHLSEELKSDPKFKEAIALGMRMNKALGKDGKMGAMGSNQEAAAANKAEMVEVGLKLNGEGGKAFGDIGEMIATKGKQAGIDLSNMPIEDAIMLLFSLIADDARKDMREMMTEMNATRLRRGALREAESLIKKELADLRASAKDKFDALPADQKEKFATFEDYLKTQSLTMPKIHIDYTTGKATLGEKGSIADVVEEVGVGGEPDAPPGEHVGAMSSGMTASNPDELLVADLGIRSTARQEVETVDASVAHEEETEADAGLRAGSEHDTEEHGGYTATFESAELDCQKLRDGRDSLAELGEEQQLRMQMVMDRMNKADQAASNTLKKFSEICSQIIGNMK